MTLVAVKNLSLSIHGTQILHEVSLSVAPGEVVAVTGESGSGKSMTALAIMQLLPDGSETTGAIDLDGEDVTQARETRMCELRGNNIGMVFQEPMTALNPVQTIGAQVGAAVQQHRPALTGGRLVRVDHIADKRGLAGDVDVVHAGLRAGGGRCDHTHL